MMDGLLCALELDVVRKCGSEAVRTVRRSPFERGRRFGYGRTAGVVWRGLCAIRVGCGCRREQVVGGALAQRREGGQRGRAERQALEMAWSRNGDGRCRSERHLWRACDAGRMGMVVDGSSAWSRLWALYLDAVCVCWSRQKAAAAGGCTRAFFGCGFGCRRVFSCSGTQNEICFGISQQQSQARLAASASNLFTPHAALSPSPAAAALECDPTAGSGRSRPLTDVRHQS